MRSLGMSRAGAGTRVRFLVLLGSLIALLVCALAVAGTADAARKSSKRRNWPNTYVRHPLKQGVGPPTQAFSANLRGDMATAGNTLETCAQNLVGQRRGRNRSRAQVRDNAACLNESNNGLDMKYVNVDPGDGDRFNSSTATLTVPAGATVKKAFLYWAGDLSSGITDTCGPRTGHAAPAGDSPTNNRLYTTVKLRAGGGSYATIDATAPGRNGRWDYVDSWYSQPGNCPGSAYQVRADVTSQVSAGVASRARRRGADESLPVTVANVQAGTGQNRYAGWNLIVVWETPTAPWRDVTLYDGFALVQVQAGQQLVVGPLNFTGFKTPADGKVDAHVTVWATEGDRGITGDYLALGGLDTSCTGLAHQSDAAHHVDNFFNSSIANGGVDVPGRTPSFSNQLGFDFSTLHVPEGTIPNAATGASVCLGTVGDTYFFGGIAFSSLIQAPNLGISKDVDHSHANPGDVVTYTTAVRNPSTRPADDPLFGTPVNEATNLVVADLLPSGLDFVAFTANPGNACTYTSATRAIICHAGTLEPDANFTYSYQARVAAVAVGAPSATLTNTACYSANSIDQPDVSFTGCDPAAVTVPPGPPVPADLGVVKSVNHDIVAPGDKVTWTVTGTNYGPATSTGFTLADQLPAGVQFVSETHSAALTCTTPAVGSSGAITCTAPSVPAKPAEGSSLTLTIIATVPSTTADGTLLLNIATVNGDQPEPTPDPHPNRDQTITRVIVPDQPVPPNPTPLPPEPNGPPQPPAPPAHAASIPRGPAGTRLALHKRSFPHVVRAGATIDYTIRLGNVGDASALRVRLCDRPPRGVIVTSAPRFHRVGRLICTAIPVLRTLGHRTFHLTARARLGTRRIVVNRAVATARNARLVRARARTIVIRPAPPVTG